MYTIKTAAFTFTAIVACLVLLLTPDFYRDEAPGSMLAARQELAPTNQQQHVRFEHKQIGALESYKPLVVAQDKPESLADSSAPTQSINWSLLLYPELARTAELENQPANAALAELLGMLSSDDPAIRLAVIESLGDMSIAAALPALSAALNDPNPQLRIAALEGIASHEDISVVPGIEPYLFDPEREVRVAAIAALADLESGNAVHALAGLLSDQDSWIRHHAVNALGEIGGKTAMMYLLQARYDPNTTIRINAEAILAELKYKALY